MWEFADRHPIIFFFIMICFGVPAMAIFIGVIGEVIDSFFEIFKKNGKKK